MKLSDLDKIRPLRMKLTALRTMVLKTTQGFSATLQVDGVGFDVTNATALEILDAGIFYVKASLEELGVEVDE